MPKKTNKDDKSGSFISDFANKKKLAYIEFQKKQNEKRKRNEEIQKKLMQSRLDKKMALSNLSKEIQKAKLKEVEVRAKIKAEDAKKKEKIRQQILKQKNAEQVQRNKFKKQSQEIHEYFQKLEEATQLEAHELKLKKIENKKYELKIKRDLNNKLRLQKQESNAAKREHKLKVVKENEKLKQELLEFKVVRDAKKLEAKKEMFSKKQEIKIQKDTHKQETRERIAKEREETRKKLQKYKKLFANLKLEKVQINLESAKREAKIKDIETSIKEKASQEITLEKERLEFEIEQQKEKDIQEAKKQRLKDIRELTIEEKRSFSDSEIHLHEERIEENRIKIAKEDFDERVRGVFSDFKRIEKVGTKMIDSVFKPITDNEMKRLLRDPAISLSIQEYREEIDNAQPVEFQKLFFHAAMVAGVVVKEEIADNKFNTILKALLTGYAIPIFDGVFSIGVYGKKRRISFSKTVQENQIVINIEELIDKKYLEALKKVVFQKLNTGTGVQIIDGLIIKKAEEGIIVLSNANLFRI